MRRGPAPPAAGGGAQGRAGGGGWRRRAGAAPPRRSSKGPAAPPGLRRAALPDLRGRGCGCLPASPPPPPAFSSPPLRAAAESLAASPFPPRRHGEPARQPRAGRPRPARPLLSSASVARGGESLPGRVRWGRPGLLAPSGGEAAAGARCGERRPPGCCFRAGAGGRGDSPRCPKPGVSRAGELAEGGGCPAGRQLWVRPLGSGRRGAEAWYRRVPSLSPVGLSLPFPSPLDSVPGGTETGAGVRRECGTVR